MKDHDDGVVDFISGLLLLAYYALAVWLLLEEVCTVVPVSARLKYYGMKCCYQLAAVLGTQGMRLELKYLQEVTTL